MQEIYLKTYSFSTFQKYLSRQKLRKHTVDLYASDIRGFLRWTSEELSIPLNRLENLNYLSIIITPELINLYRTHVERVYKSKATILRKRTSLNHLLSFLNKRSLNDVKNSWQPKPVTAREYIPASSTFVFGALLLGIVFTIPFGSFSPSYPLLYSNQMRDLPKSVPSSTSAESITILPSHKKQLLTLKEDPTFSVIIGSIPDSNVKALHFNENTHEKNFENTIISGSGIIREGSKTATIYHPEFTSQTHLLVTPTSPLHGDTLYIEHVSDGFAVISLESVAKSTVNFNWLSDTSVMYHSIH